jgi:hypothetical protein
VRTIPVLPRSCAAGLLRAVVQRLGARKGRATDHALHVGIEHRRFRQPRSPRCALGRPVRCLRRLAAARRTTRVPVQGKDVGPVRTEAAGQWPATKLARALGPAGSDVSRRGGATVPVLLSVTAQSRGLAAPARCLGPCRRRYTAENAQQVVDCSCRRRAHGDAIECRSSCRDEDVERDERVDTLSVGQSVDPCALTPSGMASPGRASR